jgi:class 3 adenylate cyclase
MEELVTLKEEQVDKLQGVLRDMEYQAGRQAQEFEQRLRALEKRYQREITKLQGDISQFRKIARA